MVDGEVVPSAAQSDPEIEEAEKLFAEFLNDNPASSIRRRTGANSGLAIRAPWGDESLRIDIDDGVVLAAVLNGLILPPRLTGIYHKATGRLEILWTAFPITGPGAEILGRNFEFSLDGNSVSCEFSASSSCVVDIAKRFAPVRPSETNYRNLQSYNMYAELDGSVRDLFSHGPMSFWITLSGSWDEAATIHLIQNLNFHLKYYDALSPIVLIHDSEKRESSQRHRYIHGEFPEVIKARALDENLLSFWNFIGSDPNVNNMVQFILYYRIIEYAAFSFVDLKIRAELRKLLLAPHFSPTDSRTVDAIVSVIPASNSEEITRFRTVIAHCVDPRTLWLNIKANVDFFAKEQAFDGGFVLKPFIGKGETEDTFKTGRVGGFSDTIRKIRNTLSHGKDQETAGVILPTLRNFNLLRPWVDLIATAAGEVVAHKDVT